MSILVDFILLAAIAAVCVVAFRRLTAKRPCDAAYRYGVGLALAAAVLLCWVNGSLGLIGNARNAANLTYGGVLAIGFVGALVARFQPRGMARALFATALAQVLVAGVALGGALGPTAPPRPLDTLALTAFFTALWAASAWLFWRAAKPHAPASAELET